MQNKFIIIYSTIDSINKAKKIAKTLVEKKLAACVNILGEIESIYKWKEEICEDKEFVLIIKSKENLFRKAREEIEKNHPYENPCIIALPITDGSQNFLDWISENTLG